MDSMNNPFAPNAGSRPPELVGRDDLLEAARVLMGRTQLRRSAQSILMTGLRGVGKTVLLNEIMRMAEGSGNVVPVYMEACESRTFAEMLASPLRQALLKMNRLAGAKTKVLQGLSALRNYLGTVKISFGEIGIELEPLVGIADTGDRQFDLIELLTAVAEAAADKQKAVVLLIDEVQCLSEDELADLVMALHRLQQRQLPLVMVGAGLPILAKLVGEAKSYAERLFVYPQVGALSDENARRAICVPFGDAGIRLTADAQTAICAETRGYPYFIQAWGSELWNFIEREPITMEDVVKVRDAVWSNLDLNFFRIRMERLTPREREFLLAMTTDEDVPCRVSDVAVRLNVPLSAVAPCRASLIRKGMVYSPQHGMLAYTVPLFGAYLRRKNG